MQITASPVRLSPIVQLPSDPSSPTRLVIPPPPPVSAEPGIRPALPTGEGPASKPSAVTEKQSDVFGMFQKIMRRLHDSARGIIQNLRA